MNATPKTAKCLYCNKQYKPKRGNKGMFCSMRCRGDHKRHSNPYTKEWLAHQYWTLGRTCNEIAAEVGRDEKSVWSWLRGFGIKTRMRGEVDNGNQFNKGMKPWCFGKNLSEETKAKLSVKAKARGAIPFDPKVGPPFKGKRGAEIPSWKGGVTPERQAFYASSEWKDAVKKIWKRDNAACQKCGKRNAKGMKHSFAIHHIESFSIKEKRADVNNLVLLCTDCHQWVHSKKNKNKEFLKPMEMKSENPLWKIHNGDCISHQLLEEKEGGMQSKSVDFAIFSPPFPGNFRVQR